MIPQSKLLLRRLWLFTFILVLISTTNAQPGGTLIERLDGGVAVLSVEKDSAAEKAGIKAGDILLGWAQGSRKGNLSSPFDFRGVSREWASRGAVVLDGRRLSRSMSWKLNAASWGILPGSNWSTVSSIHLRLQDLATAKQWDALTAYGRSACGGFSDATAARSYCFFEAGTWLAYSHHLVESAVFYREAIADKPVGEPYLVAQIYEEWGEDYLRIKDWRTAAEYYTKALLASEALSPRSLNVAFYLEKLEVINVQMGAVADAQRFARRALDIRRKLCLLSPETLAAMNSVGVLAQKVGDLAVAEESLREGIELANRIAPQGPAAASLYNNLGAVEEKRGDLAIAERLFLRSLDASQRLKPHDYSLSYLWSNLGSVAFQRRNIDRAKQYFEKALAIQEGAGNSDAVGMTLHNLGLASEELNQLEEAEALIRRALLIQEKTGKLTELAQTFDTLGTVLRRRGQIVESEEVLRKALAMRHSNSPESLDVAETTQHLGELLEQKGDLQEAAVEYAEAADIRRELAPSSAAYAESLAALGNIALSQKRLEEAEGEYEEAVYVLERQTARLGESRDSVHFHGKYADYYRRLISVLMQQGKVDLAFEAVERSRAQSLLQMLRIGSVNVHAGVAPKLLQRDRELQFSLVSLQNEKVQLQAGQRELLNINKRIAEASAALERVRAQMREQSPRYASLVEPKPLRLRDMQNLLDRETLVLEYSLGLDRSYLFVLSRTDLASIELSGREAIEASARRLHELWSSKGAEKTETDEAACDLSRAILRPADALLKQHHRLLIVADGALEYVPFAALPVQGAQGDSYPLMRDKEISYLNSMSTLFFPRQEHRSFTMDVSVIADPVFSPDDPRVLARGTSNEVSVFRSDVIPSAFPASEDSSARAFRLARLKYSRQEADAIGAVTPKARFAKHLDFDASRATAINPALRNSRIVHFATHGFLDSQNPLLSGLVFSEVDRLGRQQIGFFGLEDVFNADLPVDLVVLSACQTALGEEVDTEGFVGLTWGFQYAGARRVVASLWNVDDAATAELMRLFYVAMERDGLRVPAALRRAQIMMSRERQWASPYYWAAFIVQGG